LPVTFFCCPGQQPVSELFLLVMVPEKNTDQRPGFFELADLLTTV
jgi:hypothetical protein